MDFFKKAAALALSVLGALFTNVEPPKAQAQPKPAAVQPAKPARIAQLSRPAVLLAHEPEGTLTVVVFRTSDEPLTDQANERFLEVIGGRQSVKHPLTTMPWYMNGSLFASPTIDDASAIFRALVANDSVDR